MLGYLWCVHVHWKCTNIFFVFFGKWINSWHLISCVQTFDCCLTVMPLMYLITALSNYRQGLTDIMQYRHICRTEEGENTPRILDSYTIYINWNILDFHAVLVDVAVVYTVVVHLRALFYIVLGVWWRTFKFTDKFKDCGHKNCSLKLQYPWLG